VWRDDEEFFIGYEPPMPPRLARFVRRVVIGLACLAPVGAGVVAVGHVPLDGGTFEFGHVRPVSGTIVERPYPVLRPDPATGAPWPLLVAPGKHGAGDLVRGLDGQRVTLMGTRIARGAHTMIEIDPGSVPSHTRASPPPAGVPRLDAAARQSVELTGEVVDSKCFLGVMVPGDGKTHKDCAALCLLGGIPPALHVRDRAGRSALLLLTDPSGAPIGRPAVEAAGETIIASGVVQREAGWLVLRTDPATWRDAGR
jgi:hypothetical protein